MIEPVPVGDVLREWDAILFWLRPAFALAGKDPADVLAELQAGGKTAYRLSGGGAGYIIASIGTAGDTGALAVWINWVGGRAYGSPDQQMAAMRGVISDIEAVGLQLGATEARAAGRPGWARVFRGYERLPDRDGVRIRKVLKHGQG